jgi:hypothetical protein
MTDKIQERTIISAERSWLETEIVAWVKSEDEVKKLRKTASWIRATDPAEASELEARATATESLASQTRERILARLGNEGPESHDARERGAAS